MHLPRSSPDRPGESRCIVSDASPIQELHDAIQRYLVELEAITIATPDGGRRIAALADGPLLSRAVARLQTATMAAWHRVACLTPVVSAGGGITMQQEAPEHSPLQGEPWIAFRGAWEKVMYATVIDPLNYPDGKIPAERYTFNDVIPPEAVEMLRSAAAVLRMQLLAEPLTTETGDDAHVGQAAKPSESGDAALPPARLKAKALHEWATSKIPGADEMTVSQLFAAIEQHPDCKGNMLDMLPPNAATFGKYLRDAGVKRYDASGKRMRRMSHFKQRHDA